MPDVKKMVVCQMAENDACGCHGDCPHFFRHEETKACFNEDDDLRYCEIACCNVGCVEAE